MTSQRTAALVSTTLASFLAPFMGSALNVALPDIARDFSLSAVSLGWVATSYLLTSAALLLAFGRLADIHGRRKVFLAGVAVYTLFSALCALAGSYLFLIACRLAQGVGGAMVIGSGAAILLSVFPPEERGRVLGINVAAVYSGLSLGPVFGGFLTQAWGWRSVFWANIPFGAAAYFTAEAALKEEGAGAGGEAFDLAGAALFGAGLGTLMWGFSLWTKPAGFALTMTGALLLTVFAVWEGRVGRPLIDVRLFRDNRVFAFSNLAALINYSATSAVGFLLSLYLQYVKGLDPKKTGLLLILQPVVMAVCSPAAGRLSDRIEPRLLASAGMTVSGIGMFLLVFLSGGTSFYYIAACLLCLGLGFGLFSSPNTNAVMGAVDKRYYGVASAALGTMRMTGQMFSLGMVMLVLALTMGGEKMSTESAPLFLRSLRVLSLLFVPLCAAGVFASLARGNRPGS